MIGTFDPGADIPRNSRKHRRLDDIPPDGGGEARPIDSGGGEARLFGSGPSYKDSLMKDNTLNLPASEGILEDDDIEIQDSDVTRSLIDGIISIEFSKRFQSLAEKSLDQTLVVKLLGWKIGYTTLRTKISELWKPQHAFRLMDIEHDYFLVTFKLRADYLKALADGPWTIFGHYLTVHPWTSSFSTVTPYPTQVMVWIRLPGLHVSLYKKSLIEEIGESIGPVAKLDYQTELGRRGRFAQMAISVDLSKPLISKIIVNGKIQLIETKIPIQMIPLALG
ncbi:hypothetical protein V6N12_047521 [Hibiscus sabdariffa]|uniref:DUF4283 domain-containing protein n=1 Tax=Hibiscus sabdariffa TaxID=183260 RepID=A0ABR2DCU0_9ROSI